MQKSGLIHETHYWGRADEESTYSILPYVGFALEPSLNFKSSQYPRSQKTRPRLAFQHQRIII